MDSISKISVNGVTYAIEGTTYQFEQDGNSLKMGVNEGTKTAIYTPSVPSWLTGTQITGTGSNITAYISGAKVGDMYLNTSTENIYQCTSSNKWAYKCNIKGTNGTNATTTSVFSSTANGLAPSTASANQEVAETTSSVKYLCSDKKWRPLPANAFLAGQTYSVMGASGTNHASGLVPDPGATAGTSKYLREDGTWAEPASGYSEITVDLIPVVMGDTLLANAGSNIPSGAIVYNTTNGNFYQYDGSSTWTQISPSWSEWYYYTGENMYHVYSGQTPTLVSDSSVLNNDYTVDYVYTPGYIRYKNNTIGQVFDIDQTTFDISIVSELSDIQERIAWLPYVSNSSAGDILIKNDGGYWYTRYHNSCTHTTVTGSGSILLNAQYDITVVQLTGDVSGIVFQGTFHEGQINTVILYNSTASVKTATIVHNPNGGYVCAGGENLSLEIPAGGYGEVSFLFDIGGTDKTFIRAV